MNSGETQIDRPNTGVLICFVGATGVRRRPKFVFNRRLPPFRPARRREAQMRAGIAASSQACLLTSARAKGVYDRR